MFATPVWNDRLVTLSKTNRDRPSGQNALR